MAIGLRDKIHGPKSYCRHNSVTPLCTDTSFMRTVRIFTSASVFRGLTVVVVFVVFVVIVVVFEQIADSNILVLMETPL